MYENQPVHLFFAPPPERAAHVAIFLSGSGSNALRLLEREAAGDAHFQIVCLVTDAPERSRAAQLAERFGKTLVSLDIRNFYLQRGESKVSLATARGREIREAWTQELRALLAPLQIDFGVLAGFVPLSNITQDFPCLNVHPGDLTVVDEANHRQLIGLHTVPIEAALMRGEKSLRSSVILAGSYCGTGAKEMDNGPLLGISPPMMLDAAMCRAEYWRAIRERRVKPREADELSQAASHLQEKLKVAGDWVVLPPVVDDFARGCFGYRGNALFWRSSPLAQWQAVRTVEYSPSGSPRPLKA